MKKRSALLMLLTLSAIAGAVSAAAQVSFSPPMVIPAGGSSPTGLAVGDFNGDGIPDLAVLVGCTDNCGPTPGRGSVAIHLGNGDGTFRSPMVFEVGYFPTYVAVGDFNGDGILDLAVANMGFTSLSVHGSLSILLGNGDGTFAAQNEFDIGKHYTFVAVADFNGDCIPDLALADYEGRGYFDGGEVVVRLGNGDGTFEPPQRLDFPGTPARLAIGDFNEDGALDLAVTTVSNLGSRGGIFFVAGNGDGTFQGRRAIDSPGDFFSLAAADFRNTGNLDLAVTQVSCCGMPSQTSVKLGNGDGSFGPQAQIDMPVASLQTSDFDGDGNYDVAGLVPAPDNMFNSRIHVILGNGDGTFQAPAEFDVGQQSVQMVVADFNGDGQPDLAVTLAPGGSVAILLNTTR